MKRILFAADTFKECNQFLNDLANDLFERGIIFDIDKRTMSLKTESAYLICVPGTSNHSGVFQRQPFDYYIFVGCAKWKGHEFHKLCMSRMKLGAKEIQNMDELVQLICEE